MGLEGFAEIYRILRQGGDELELGFLWFRDPLLEGEGIFDNRNRVLAALLASFKGGAAPFICLAINRIISD